MTPTRGQVAAPLVDFTDLYEQHAAHVHRFALYLSGDSALADDLTSEAFVRVWTARDRVELSTVRAYLFAIVWNLFLEARRRDRRGVVGGVLAHVAAHARPGIGRCAGCGFRRAMNADLSAIL